MKPRPMPYGYGDLHLGASHVRKHWLDPREMWEDIAGDVPDDVRPRLLWERVQAEPATDLRRAYDHGYQATIDRLAAPHAEPPTGWTRQEQRRNWVRHVGVGVIVIVDDKNRLRTAYRAADFRLLDYRCPPRDPASVKLRVYLAELAALRRLAVHGGPA